MALPASGVLGDTSSGHTNAEFAVEIEDFRDFVAQLPGGAARAALTISGGAVVPGDGVGGGHFTVDTEGAAGTDDLASVTATYYTEGQLIRLYAASTSRLVTLKHGTGNLSMLDGADLTLYELEQWIEFQLRSTTWVETQRYYPPDTRSATAITSGTAQEFTALPAWLEEFDLIFIGMSTNGTSVPIVQLGRSGGYEATNYYGSVGGSYETADDAQHSTGFALAAANAAARIYHGRLTFTLADRATNTWVVTGGVGQSNAAGAHFVAGHKALSATLDRVRVTTVGGSDTFDSTFASPLFVIKMKRPAL